MLFVLEDVMLKDVKMQFGGREYSLLFNDAAMFAAQEVFGEEKDLAEIIFDGTAAVGQAFVSL